MSTGSVIAVIEALLVGSLLLIPLHLNHHKTSFFLSPLPSLALTLKRLSQLYHDDVQTFCFYLFRL